MNLKKYLEKRTIKKILFNFVFILGLFTAITLLINGELPKNYMEWVLISTLISIYYGIDSIRFTKKIESTDQLTKDNYWKLKNELKRKVNRKRKHNG